MKFADIPYHDDIKLRMREMVDSGHIPHALLLEGPQGCGKYSLARALAQYIHCTNRTHGDSCGRCPSCVQHSSLNQIDTYMSFPVLKRKSGQTTLSEDYLPEFRQFLTDSPFMDFDRWLSMLGNPNGQPLIYVDEAAALLERMNRTARQSKYKIVLMWLPERMQDAAANKLLKLIEEPYSDTLFIMVTDNAKEILPTIYSRTQRIAVRRYTECEISDILVNKGIPATDAETVASLAEGNVNSALRMAGDDSTKALYLELFIELMRKAYLRQVGDLRKWSTKVADMGREGTIRFYDYCARLVRENFILNIGDLRLISMTQPEMEFSRRFSPFINVVNVERIFETLTSARNDTMLNGNGKIIAFDLAVKMILLIKQGQE
ncbi:MAG: AAA family ATPase [Muribaculaceae bacterium]|nr:AAA family ATPase [Muribaculaceae bacterium]